MPLVRAREQFGYERFEGVYVWMRDGASHVFAFVGSMDLTPPRGAVGLPSAIAPP
jgi:hypothetical protein